MNNFMSLVMSLVFAICLTAIAGFVVSSIKGYPFELTAAIPFGIAIGFIIYLFGMLVTAEDK